MKKPKKRKPPDPRPAMLAACRAMTAWHDSVLTLKEKQAKVEKRLGAPMAKAYRMLVKALKGMNDA